MEQEISICRFVLSVDNFMKRLKIILPVSQKTNQKLGRYYWDDGQSLTETKTNIYKKVAVIQTVLYHGHSVRNTNLKKYVSKLQFMNCKFISSSRVRPISNIKIIIYYEEKKKNYTERQLGGQKVIKTKGYHEVGKMKLVEYSFKGKAEGIKNKRNPPISDSDS